MKKTIIKGLSPDIFEVYDDGSAMCVCSECEKRDEISPDKYEKIRGKHEWYKTYTCLDCWKKAKEATRIINTDTRRGEIIGGQAYNLAFQAVLKEMDFGEGFLKRVEEIHQDIVDHINKING